VPLVDLRDLSVRYAERQQVFDPVSITLEPGGRLGIAGESGCGKTTLLKAAVGLLPATATITGSCTIRGRTGYIPQQALASLSPFLTAGEQITELTRSARRTADLLGLVGLDGPRFHQAYPHQLSGGERQCLLAAQALALGPDLIVADEPTANLDPDREAALLDLLHRHSLETGAAILVASHRERVFQTLGCPVHRMTPAFVDPASGSRGTRALPGVRPARPLLAVRRLTKSFRRRDWLTRSRPVLRALDDVSMEIRSGECVVLYGPSGAGKSTLARCIAGRERWDAGIVEWHNGAGAPAPRRVQLVQQEPSESLNPRLSIREVLQEACREADADWLPRILLPREWIDRRTSELSEGQRARIAILRAAAALQQGLLILDESLASLDPANRGHILSFLRAMQEERNLSLLLVTHDIEVGADLNARVVRLRSGHILGDAATP
jgi:ABC-type glutathione transport system ATPase component